MYLSRVKLDRTKRMTMKAMVSPSIFHGGIERSFPGERKRRLWRIDRLCGEDYILILSEDVPELEEFASQFGYQDSCMTKSYDKILNAAREGTRWRFRLVANPTYKSGANEKITAHTSEKYQKEWLIRKSQTNGFLLDEGEFSVTKFQWYNFYKKDQTKQIHLISVAYEGILAVTNAKSFQGALCRGIGREKAYGMGLLTIMHL